MYGYMKINYDCEDDMTTDHKQLYPFQPDNSLLSHAFKFSWRVWQNKVGTRPSFPVAVFRQKTIYMQEICNNRTIKI